MSLADVAVLLTLCVLWWAFSGADQEPEDS